MREDFGKEKSYLRRAGLDGGFAMAITSGGHGVLGRSAVKDGWIGTEGKRETRR